MELTPTRILRPVALDLAIELEHPAYNCVYLALAMETSAAFVTADERLARIASERGRPELRSTIVSLCDWGNADLGRRARTLACRRLLFRHEGRVGYGLAVERKRYIPDIVAPRYQLRVEDLGNAHFLHVRCEGCRRIALIEAAELRRRFAPHLRLLLLGRGLACARCPESTPAHWSIYRAE